ncbi:hypothetical protein MKX03_013453 [Papaver bracteatum]|nr:hypothetical protein MKX03_013453 [Papaver bracteatum]
MYYYKGSSKSWSDGYLPAWIALLVAVSIMSISWDLFVDWNLGIFNWVPGVPTVTTQIFTGQRQWWYYGFILLDILFRISWAWRLSDLDSSCLPFFLSLVEILRRIMWIPLRIEAWQVSQGIPARPVELHGHGGV